MLTLKGRTCVFAGATGMVGRGAVKALVQAGMNVVMVTHNLDDAKGIITSLEGAGGRCVAVSNAQSDAEIFKWAQEEFGSVDVIISNTGGFNAPKRFEDISAEELKGKMEHQLMGAWSMVQQALPYLEKSRAGRVILMSSAGAQDGFTGENICDSVARGAVISLTYCLARELVERGITVNCIAKSGVINDHAPHKSEHFDVESIKNRIPLGRIGSNDDFGAAVQYLASEEAGFVTGQVLGLSGGLHIG